MHRLNFKMRKKNELYLKGIFYEENFSSGFSKKKDEVENTDRKKS